MTINTKKNKTIEERLDYINKYICYYCYDSMPCKKCNIFREKILMVEIKKLKKAVLWALGSESDFKQRKEGEGAYWWRKELRKRAGL